MITTIPEEVYHTSACFIERQTPVELRGAKLGIICGSGLGGIVDTIDSANKVEIPYDSIPGFVQSTVAGHSGKLVIGLLGESRTAAIILVGRFHLYEGYSPQQCTFPIRVMRLLGVEYLVVTNACGGLNPSFKVGDIMVINDHFSLPTLTGENPLRGPNLESFGPRFLAVSDAYTYWLRKLAFRAALETGIDKGDITEGTYGNGLGPSYESRVEARFIRDAGADVIGMSTVPEVIVARHCDMRILGLSLITNKVIVGRGKDAKKQVLSEMGIEHVIDTEIDTELTVTNHEEVLETSARRSNALQKMVARFTDLLAEKLARA